MQRWKPMLAGLGEEGVLDSDGYIFEPKLDGIRAICYFDQDGLALFSRNGNNMTAAYPELDFAESLAADQCVLDGEVVLYDEAGNPDFHALVKRHHRGRPPTSGRPVTFAVFDVLHLDGRDLIETPLEERKEALEDVFAKRHPRVDQTVYTTDGRRIWKIMTDRGQEGVIAKRRGSLYYPGKRSDVWLKVKSFNTVDAVIVGFRSDRRPVSSLALGLYNEADELEGIGRVGTGFSDAMTRKLRALLEPSISQTPTVVRMPEEVPDILWVAPEHVCEVRYLERGPNGALRHPSFLRLRPDKEPSECRLDHK